MAFYLDFFNSLISRRQAVTVSEGSTDGDKLIATALNGLIDVSLLPVRKVGFAVSYTGTDGSAVGFLDDYDGKWVYLSLNSIRTIGNANSGAAIAALWTKTLFEFLWTQYSNTQCPLLDSTGTAVNRGATATADYNANRRITLPDYRGRIVGTAGSGSGLTARSKGAAAGTETHILLTAEMPSHTHTIDNVSSFNTGGTQFGGSSNALSPQSTTNATGNGQSHNNMQPTIFEHLIISAGAR